MRIVKFTFRKTQQWGVLRGQEIGILAGPPYPSVKRTTKTIPLCEVTLEAPASATKIILAGLNYRDHARELGMRIPREPVIFIKPPTALIGAGQPIVYPDNVKRLDYEAELAIVVKKTGRNIPVKRAGEHILGYTCLNDVTARDLQKIDGQWTRAKSFDTFCPLGPWIETDLDPSRLAIAAYLNGKKVQSSTTRNLIFSVSELVSFVSRVMTILPGDVISTGTPPGVGPMRPGDTVDVAIEGIGVLSNRIVREEWGC